MTAAWLGVWVEGTDWEGSVWVEGTDWEGGGESGRKLAHALTSSSSALSSSTLVIPLTAVTIWAMRAACGACATASSVWLPLTTSPLPIPSALPSLPAAG